MAPSDRVSVRRRRFGARARSACAALAALLAAGASAVALAQPAAQTGRIAGVVTDAASGAALEGVAVALAGPAGSESVQQVRATGADGRFAFEALRAGTYQLAFTFTGYRDASIARIEVAPGQEVRADRAMEARAEEEADSMPAPPGTEEITIHGSGVSDLLGSIEKRTESDQLVNLLSAEELAKFAAVDVADALKRVAGVNVVEGRFAVIRGLEDRYSSTTFNGAPVPSADPLRQSVQLDLFPSDVVSGLVIAKSFAAETPGNSGAGSLDIETTGYPEQLTLKLSGGSGFNDNALDEFAGYQRNSPIADFQGDSDVIETDFAGSIGGSWNLRDREVRMKFLAANEIDYDTALGRVEGKEPRLPSCRDAGGFSPISCQASNAVGVVESGGLATKSLTVSNGVYDYTLSERDEQLTLFGGLGVDLDEEGAHRVDFSAFHTKKEIESVERLDDGMIAGFDYANTPVENFASPFLLYRAGDTTGRARATADGLISDFRQDVEQLASGPLGIDPIVRGQSVVQDRKLTIYQLNGRHLLDALLAGLGFDWAANYARTEQDETAFRMRYWYEPYAATSFDSSNLPVPPFPPQESHFPVAAFGPGSWRTNTRDIIFNENQIDETQWFGRGDFSYEIGVGDWLALEAGAGFWLESADRELEFTDFQGTPATAGRPGVLFNFLVEGPAESQLGPNVFGAYGLGDLRTSESEFERDITAGALSLKGTFWEDWDLVGGVRLEDIDIVSENRPFTGRCINARGQPAVGPDPSRSGRGCPPGYLPEIFPTRYLYLDRQDNPSNPFFIEDPRFAPFGQHDQILGIALPVNANGFVDQLSADDLFDVLTGEIDEFTVLPSVAGAYRPIEGMALRAAYSETMARPSFRELAYYATIVPGEDERLIGNPFLQLSDVTSYDGRVEYVWGDYADLLAFSVFYKTIDKPIEVIQLRDFSVNDDLFSGPFRIYRNNENEAELLGGEVEARLTLGVLSDLAWNWPTTKEYAEALGFLEDFSVGGNVTYIDAQVERSAFERRFGDLYYLSAGDDPRQPPGQRLPKDRRLFNQPEWIANADVTFDQPDWGTKLTLSVFAISDVLRTAGSPSLSGGGGLTNGLTLDEYTAPFYQLDFVASQSFAVPFVPGTFTLKMSAKNLTDSRRGVIYDTEVVSGTQYERRFYVGRDYSFALQYELIFDGSPWPQFGRE
ncbi:MAG: TonB-dependent receptor [Actinobacteria bacterium]|nr:TonB-dependent receptor [Actinomycetota bacterium]